ncbi:DUF1178 family protein [Falsirhodobacter sp. 20TX0035]|uniref:DUF1178 family protein n=1 Tax=Falsirhodobacter sp. 20TX0035 TaxID=3022019 RepID=UPI00232F5B43|nr:DUF1178 family protein [Falsirhodobacter sp. 20TX0035]MDB6453597.1 DUF1178 family protein [Falsirhodobacter sp. 20TX0035]
MIRYALKCQQGHDFESWFQSAAAFDALKAAGHVTCPDCGGTRVEKAMMAPSLGMAPKPPSDREKAIADLKRHVEANSDYVGMNFAAEARRMHEGEAPARSIHGEAHLDEARQLLEDGIPVAPLPFRPTRRTN